MLVDDAARDRVRRQIEALKEQYGADVADNPDQLRALLLDTLPADRKAVEEATNGHPPPTPEPHLPHQPVRDLIWTDDDFPPVTDPGTSGPTPTPPAPRPVPKPPVTPTPPVTPNPPVIPTPPVPTQPRPRSSKRTWVAVGAAVLLIVLAVTAGVSGALSGEESDPKEPASGQVRDDPEAPNATGTELMTAPGTFAGSLDRYSTMGARNAGVELLGLSEVSSVGSGEDELAPPSGGSLIAFQLGSGVCDVADCKSWRTLDLSVAVNGTRRPLPSTKTEDTFVVAAPLGTASVDLVMTANGYTQTLSLLDGKPGPDNIAVLGREPVFVDIKKKFWADSTSSIALTDATGPGSNQLRRHVNVKNASLWFFWRGHRPSSTRNAFLAVEHSYTENQYKDRVYDSATMVFIAADGKRYRGRDLDRRPNYTDTVFEVPATTTSGAVVFGGRESRTSTTGTPYTVTVENHRVPIDMNE